MREVSEILAYTNRLFAPEGAAARQAREFVERELPELAPISISATEGKILQLLMRLVGVKNMVEIGSLCGYSAFWMAEALPAEGRLHAIEYEPLRAATIRRIADEAGGELAQKITVHQGKAQDILPHLAAEAPFDMVFIDADKAAYPAYLDWAEQHLRVGGLIVGDNTLLFGAAIHDVPPAGDRAPSRSAWQAMREFNARLANPERYHSVLLPTQEGMTIAIKR
jgi:predicted O-methyltransferase YrrM